MQYVKELNRSGCHDVVVCGGGFSGFAAAYSAAREGLDVLLIEKGTSLGGVGTQCLVNHILGVRCAKEIGFSICTGGIYAEIERRLLARGAAIDVNSIDPQLNPHGWKRSLAAGLIFDGEEMKLLLEEMLTSVGVKILYLTDIVDAVCCNGYVKHVVVHNKSGLSYIEGIYFIDATGDGDVCCFAGAESDIGDDEGGIAAASLEMHVEDVDDVALSQYMKETNDLRFKSLIEQAKANREWNFPYEIFISVQMCRKDVFMINTIRQVGIDGTDAESLTCGILDGRRENFELLRVMRKYFPGFSNAKVRYIAPMIGIRETRRIKGEYTLTVDDLITGREFDDGIALSGYGWDMPHPKQPSYQPFEGVKRKSPFTQIPYRCMIPMGLNNILTVGRCVSVEREALGPVRVMGPCIAMGECAGIACRLALEKNVTFSAIDVSRLREHIVKYGGFVSRDQVKE